IALLVAEDFEKSCKARWEKAGHGVRREECFHFLASFTVSDHLGRKARQEEVSSLKEVRTALEPRSSFGLAAYDGLFSA
ncbi:hypothetical protein GW17_00022949, partial [Ensete ventricosum]